MHFSHKTHQVKPCFVIKYLKKFPNTPTTISTGSNGNFGWHATQKTFPSPWQSRGTTSNRLVLTQGVVGLASTCSDLQACSVDQRDIKCTSCWLGMSGEWVSWGTCIQLQYRCMQRCVTNKSPPISMCLHAATISLSPLARGNVECTPKTAFSYEFIISMVSGTNIQSQTWSHSRPWNSPDS